MIQNVNWFTLARSALITSTFLVACNDDLDLGSVRGVISVEEELNFGDVQVGIALPLTLTLTNTGNGSLIVNKIVVGETFSSGAYEFQILQDGSEVSLSDFRLVLQPNVPRELTVQFLPYEAMELPVESFLRIETDLPDSAENPRTATVRVLGRGITSGLQVTPNPVDFGRVLVGSSREITVEIQNLLSVPVNLTTLLGADGRPQIVNQGGLGRFELVAPTPDARGSLLAPDVQLASRATISATLRYIPDPSQEDREDRGRWVISNCDNRLCEVPVTLLGRGTNSAIECMPATVDFGQVNPGSTLTRRVTCANVATEPVTVLGWRTAPGTAPEYAVAPYNGQVSTLQPGDTFDLEIQFSPTVASVGSNPSGAVIVRGRNPVAGRDLDDATISLTGEAGGPDISVLPSMLNFGRVAIGTQNRRRLLVENTGYNDLQVRSIQVTGPFTVQPTTFDVVAGEVQPVEVIFEPTAQGPINAELIITSNDSDEGELRVALAGEGVDLPPCSYTLTPADLNFGIVQVLRSTTQGIRIENTGTDDCLINDLALLAGSAPSFALPGGNETGVILEAGATKTVLVSFTPGSETTDRGELGFYISNPLNSNPVVNLRGVGSSSALLISPNEIEFGQVGINCRTRERQVTIYNTGGNQTRVLRIERPAGVSSEFEISSLPAGIPGPPGAAINPGQSIEFSIRYRAADIGEDIGFIHIFEQNRADPYVIPLFGEGSKDPLNEDRFEQLETPEVDLLFVIDDSCSMSEEQASLTANFQSFITFADLQALNYQIAVVSTDVDSCPANQAQRPLGMQQGKCGYFADGNPTQRDPNWRVITPDEQPSASAAFAAVATQGINGSGFEQGLEAAYRALSSPQITGWNTGFLRPSAYLALIFLSDEEDQSPNTVDFYVNYFLAIKGFRNTQLFSASAIVGDAPGGCGGFQADAGARYIEAARRGGGIFESICTSDWARALENLGLSVFGYKSRFNLANQPVPGTVTVELDGVDQPASMGSAINWSYDAATNSVNFSALSIPEPGSEIVVRYRPECL